LKNLNRQKGKWKKEQERPLSLLSLEQYKVLIAMGQMINFLIFLKCSLSEQNIQ